MWSGCVKSLSLSLLNDPMTDRGISTYPYLLRLTCRGIIWATLTWWWWWWERLNRLYVDVFKSIIIISSCSILLFDYWEKNTSSTLFIAFKFAPSYCKNPNRTHFDILKVRWIFQKGGWKSSSLIFMGPLWVPSKKRWGGGGWVTSLMLGTAEGFKRYCLNRKLKTRSRVTSSSKCAGVLLATF